MEFILFCHKQYGLTLRYIYIPTNLMPYDLKHEFDQIDTHTQMNEFSEIDQKIFHIIRKWELCANGSHSYHHILFGIKYDDEDNNKNNIPSWYKQSFRK
jgi:hypothetical protein